jgi:hypothetical protein
VVGLALAPAVPWESSFSAQLAFFALSLAGVFVGALLAEGRPSRRLRRASAGYALALAGFHLLRAGELMKKAGSGSDAQALLHVGYTGILLVLAVALVTVSLVLAAQEGRPSPPQSPRSP